MCFFVFDVYRVLFKAFFVMSIKVNLQILLMCCPLCLRNLEASENKLFNRHIIISHDGEIQVHSAVYRASEQVAGEL